jgi:hypothetical protein
MSLYYFHLVDGTDVLLDPEGQELKDLQAVAKSALLEARSIISGEVRTGHVRLDQSIIVEDGEGKTIHRLPFTDAMTIIWPAGYWTYAR